MAQKVLNNFFPVLVVISLIMICVPKTVCADLDFLITPDESIKLNLNEEEWDNFAPLLRGSISISKGPIIDLQKPIMSVPNVIPPEISTVSPIDFVLFIKEKRAPIDMSSLKVVAKKGIFRKEITPRLKPFIYENIVNAKNVKIPAGKYLISVYVSDVDGNETNHEYRIEVKKVDAEK